MIWLSPLILLALEQGADCAVAISGGKDSQALLLTVVAWFRERGFSGRLFAIFADLGRAEWIETRPFIEHLCQSLQIELIVVHRIQGDLLDRFDQRQAALGPDEPFWPTTRSRYCTSDLKRTPCDTYLRNARLILSLEGIRAAESEARAEKNPLTLRNSITGKRYRDHSLEDAWRLYAQDRQVARHRSLQLNLFDEHVSHSDPFADLSRFAFTWYPIFDWTIEQVWHACGTSLKELTSRRYLYKEGVRLQDSRLREQAVTGWPAHPAYLFGANRLSCSLCFMGDGATLQAGASHNPDYYRALCWREAQSGFSFQQQRWLSDIAPELLTDEMRSLLEQHPRRQRWLEAQAQRQLSGKRARKALPVLAR